jgi:hypothetical protein
MHRDYQFQSKLFWIWFRQFQEQSETLYCWQLLHINSSGKGDEIPKANFGWHDEK